MNKTKQEKPNLQAIPVIDEDVFTTSSASDFSKSVSLLFDEQNLAKKTDLNARDIAKLTQIYQMAEEYDVPLLKQMADKFIELRVSLKRKGRGEAVQMTQQISQMKRLEALEEGMKGMRK